LPWFDIRNLARKCLRINIVNGLYRVVAEGYQEIVKIQNAVARKLKTDVFGARKTAASRLPVYYEGLLDENYL
jgi:hypothetical protein